MEVVGGQQIQSPGNFMNCRENRYIIFNPPPPPPRMEKGRGGREGGDREGERERDTGREVGARAKPGNQLVCFMTRMLAVITPFHFSHILDRENRDQKKQKWNPVDYLDPINLTGGCILPRTTVSQSAIG